MEKEWRVVQELKINEMRSIVHSTTKELDILDLEPKFISYDSRVRQVELLFNKVWKEIPEDQKQYLLGYFLFNFQKILGTHVKSVVEINLKG